VRLLVAGSGSSGNALLVETPRTRLLVDAGLAPRALAARLAALGAHLFPRSVDAIIPSHVHDDHFAHAEPLARTLRAPLYLHRGIAGQRLRHRHPTAHLETGTAVAVGDILVECCAVPHDADQIALRFTAGGVTLGVATDLGHVPGPVLAFLGACDAIFLEANHAPFLLHESSYPEPLKRRVAGPLGHLSNEQVADALVRLRGSAVRSVYLAHMSRTNNEASLALAAAREARPDLELHVVPHGRPLVLHLPAAVAGSAPSRRPVQLVLPL
jgi:phosphoribosyl 1,2-cyclic phosphodiesterase